MAKTGGQRRCRRGMWPALLCAPKDVNWISVASLTRFEWNIGHCLSISVEGDNGLGYTIRWNGIIKPGGSKPFC